MSSRPAFNAAPPAHLAGVVQAAPDRGRNASNPADGHRFGTVFESLLGAPGTDPATGRAKSEDDGAARAGSADAATAAAPATSELAVGLPWLQHSQHAAPVGEPSWARPAGPVADQGTLPAGSDDTLHGQREGRSAWRDGGTGDALHRGAGAHSAATAGPGAAAGDAPGHARATPASEKTPPAEAAAQAVNQSADAARTAAADAAHGDDPEPAARGPQATRLALPGERGASATPQAGVDASASVVLSDPLSGLRRSLQGLANATTAPGQSTAARARATGQGAETGTAGTTGTAGMAGTAGLAVGSGGWQAGLTGADSRFAALSESMGVAGGAADGAQDAVPDGFLQASFSAAGQTSGTAYRLDSLDTSALLSGAPASGPASLNASLNASLTASSTASPTASLNASPHDPAAASRGAASGVSFPGQPAGGTAVHSMALHAHPASAQWRSEFSDSMRVLLQDRIQMAELKLHPADMGPIQVRISLDDGQGKMVFTAAHAETRAALEQALPALRERLAEAGITLGETSIGQPGEGQRAPSRGTPATRRAASLPAPDDAPTGSVGSARAPRANTLIDTWA